MTVSEKIRRMLHLFCFKRKEKFPRVVTMRRYFQDGVRFEIGNYVESFRIEHFGGEEEFTGRILDEIKPDDVFLDIGSSVGLVTVHAARKGARVYAFEPDSYYCSRLDKNLELNEVNGVSIIKWAVSDTDGESTLFTDGGAGNSPSLRTAGSRKETRVKTDTIDNAIRKGEIAVPDIIKMDIEGAEILALKGMKELLGSDRAPRTIFIEVHPEFLKLFSSNAEEVIELIKSYGYRKDYLFESHEQIHCIFRR